MYVALFGSEDFPLTQVLLPGLNDANTSFGVAMDKASNLGKALVEFKNEQRAALIATLRKVAYSVIAEADGRKRLLYLVALKCKRTGL